MPMLTISVKHAPLADLISPLRTASANASIFAPFGENLRHDVMAFGEHWPASTDCARPCAGLDGAPCVDRLAREERRAARLDAGGAGEIEKQAKRRFVDLVFRVVEQEIVELDVEALKSLWIGAKEIRDFLSGHGSLVRVERGQGILHYLTSHASPQIVFGRK